MTAPGSRARSREIGYAQAMADVREMLWDAEGQYRALAARQVAPAAGLALSMAAERLHMVAEWAHGAVLVYGDERLGELMEIAWQPHPGEHVPAELPQPGDRDPGSGRTR